MAYARNRKTLLATAASFAVIGGLLLGIGKADPFYIAQEVETGTIETAQIVADSVASGGQFVQFSGNTACDGSTDPDIMNGRTLAFCDDFTGTAVDTSVWSFRSSAEADWSDTPFGTGNLGNKQLEFDQPANCTVNGGLLYMTAKRESIQSQSGANYDWTSCMINTSPSYEFQYGYIEERSQLPAEKGFWPALWTWAKPGLIIPGNGETDAYEYYSDNKNALYHTQHNPGGGGCTYDPPFDPSDGMHVYGVDIQPTGTTWYVDYVEVCSTPTTSGGLTNILVDNFVFADVPPEPSTTAGEKIIDYVRAYQ